MTDTGKTAVGIADNVRMRANFPARIRAGEKLAIDTIISARGTAGRTEVWDRVYITADEDFYLRYVPGSAIVHNTGELNGRNIGTDYLFSESGALLGYNTISRILPGGSEYAGSVTYQFAVDKAEFNMELLVGILAENRTEWGEELKCKEGDTVSFKVKYGNTGTMIQENVLIQATMPEGLEYLNGKTTLKNNSDPEGAVVNDDLTGKNGMNIGNYAGGNGWAEVMFYARVADNLSGVFIPQVTVNTADGNRIDAVQITVTGEQ
jgi:uncharacterized repeat protein (TIGR01451 family)